MYASKILFALVATNTISVLAARQYNPAAAPALVNRDDSEAPKGAYPCKTIENCKNVPDLRAWKSLTCSPDENCDGKDKSCVPTSSCATKCSSDADCTAYAKTVGRKICPVEYPPTEEQIKETGPRCSFCSTGPMYKGQCVTTNTAA